MLLDRTALQRLRLELPPAASACLRFAADELQHYLRALGGVDVPLRTSADLSGAALRLGEAPMVAPPSHPDAFHIATGERGALLVGSSDRAVLHAAYRLLEDLGCAWSPHGAAQEIVPPLPADGVRLQESLSEPAFSVRAYATDVHTYHYEEPERMAQRLGADVAFTDWMGKSGANAFLFIRHPFDSQLTIPSLLPELAKRGIAPEYGGHVLPLLLPRQHFGVHPEWFPTDAHGRRTDMGNLCTSSVAALDIVAEAAVEYARQYPEMEVLHIWGADLWDGGWCSCPLCADVGPQDQSLRVCNAVAEALERAGLPLGVCYLAYHDTIDADLRGEPHPSVAVEFAPRERCYGHALDDAACETNSRYRMAFERYVEKFGGRARVFEYYGDAILFCGVAVPLTRVIAADLEYYRRAGAREISFLQFGAYSLWAHAVNFAAYAVATGGTRASTAAGCLGNNWDLEAYPPAFWRDLERVMQGIVTYGDVRRPPRRRSSEIAPRIEEAVAVLRAWIPCLERDPLEQRTLAEYSAAVLEGVGLQLAGTPQARDEAEHRYQLALDVLARSPEHCVGVWGRHNLPVIHSFHSAASRRS